MASAGWHRQAAEYFAEYVAGQAAGKSIRTSQNYAAG